MSEYPSYLIHYGIEGQKWGVRNYQNEDGTWTEEGLERRRVGNREFKSLEKITYGSSSKVKVKDIDSKVQVMRLASDILTIYNPFSIIDLASGVHGSIKKSSAINKQKKNTNIDSKTGFKLKNDKHDNYIKDLKSVNPGFKNFNENTKNNCMLCTTAYELRRRGYDAIAGDTTKGYTLKDLHEWFPKSKTIRADYYPEPKNKRDKVQLYVDTFRKAVNQDFNLDKDAKKIAKEVHFAALRLANNGRYKKEMANATFSELQRQSNSRGNLTVNWADGGGHSMAYEVRNGVVRVLDGQTGKVYKDKAVKSLLRRTIDSQFTRLDNVNFNKKAIKKVVRV